MATQWDIVNGDLFFSPPLQQRSKGWRKVFVTTRTGQEYEGIKARFGKTGAPEIHIPPRIVLNNRPEMGKVEVALDETNRDVLRLKISEKLWTPTR